MKNKIISITLILTTFCFFKTAYATLNIDTQVDVPLNCTITDTNGIIHNYAGSYLAICALDKAIKNGSISNVQFSNQYPDLGLFVTTINNVSADPNSQYWAIYQNDNYVNSGIALLTITTGDTIKLELHDFSDNNLGDQITLHINSLIPISETPIATGSGPLLTSSDIPKIENNTPTSTEETTTVISNPIPLQPTKQNFDVKKATDFLISTQKENGSFGEDIYTDWSAFALASQNYQNKTIKLIKYFEENKTDTSLLTDYERHAMALMALGLNPYDTNGKNYIKKITDSFDGKQFGDINEDNDDIFALIVLQNASFTDTDKIISNDISFILSKQKEDGSWDNSIDMTGASIEALSFFNKNQNIENALNKAKNYLKQNEKENGSWNDNISSTTWALEGILALNEKPENWIKNPTENNTESETPFDYLMSQQDTDGGIKDENLNNKIWETAYTISVISGQTWNEIMQKFEKPIETINEDKITKTSIIQNATNIETKKITKTIKSEIETPILKNSETQNTANVISAIDNPSTLNTKTIQKNWFQKMLDNISKIF